MALNDGIASATPVTPGTSTSARRSIGIVCTVAGNVELTLTGGSKIVIPVAVGFTMLPFQVTLVSSGANTTATATYFNLG